MSMVNKLREAARAASIDIDSTVPREFAGNDPISGTPTAVAAGAGVAAGMAGGAGLGIALEAATDGD